MAFKIVYDDSVETDDPSFTLEEYLLVRRIGLVKPGDNLSGRFIPLDAKLGGI